MAIVSVVKLFVRQIVLDNIFISSNDFFIIISLFIFLYDLILFSHIHIFKHEGMRYSEGALDYTRIGLCDPNNHSLTFAHCRILETGKTCFYIMKNSNLPITGDKCSANEVPSEELEDYQYMPNEPLLYDQSRDDQVLISKTNNLIPNFLDNLLKYLQLYRRDNFAISLGMFRDRRPIRADHRNRDDFDDYHDRLRYNGRFPNRFRHLPGNSQLGTRNRFRPRGFPDRP
jgi:hypothetical protein